MQFGKCNLPYHLYKIITNKINITNITIRFIIIIAPNTVIIGARNMSTYDYNIIRYNIDTEPDSDFGNIDRYI